jgi:hypothetical protein
MLQRLAEMARVPFLSTGCPFESLGRRRCWKQRYSPDPTEAHRYVLGDSSAEARPFYRENNGEPAVCILEADVVTALGRTHDNQGHWNYNQQRCQ